MTKRIFLLFLLIPSIAQAQLGELKADSLQGKHVRTVRNDDGSEARFVRKPDEKIILKRVRDPNGVLTSLSVYRLGDHGEFRNCKIYDAKKRLLFKSSYGYDSFGRLVEERLFDPKTNDIVRRFIYTYNAQGEQSKPISIVFKSGKNAEDRFKFGPTGNNPFDDEKQQKPRK